MRDLPAGVYLLLRGQAIEERHKLGEKDRVIALDAATSVYLWACEAMKLTNGEMHARLEAEIAVRDAKQREYDADMVETEKANAEERAALRAARAAARAAEAKKRKKPSNKRKGRAS
jgi:hypothetical protein